MKNVRFLGIVCSALAAEAVISLGAAPAGKTSADLIARGKYLVMVSGCNDCHSPKKFGPKGMEIDETRLLEGYVDPKTKFVEPPPTTGAWPVHANPELTAWAGPWGVSFSRNLTPDQNTGIGSWTEETFIKAIRTGKHMGASRPILPPMPWNTYAKMTDRDLKAMYAYLRTIPAISNPTPEPIPPPVMVVTPKKPAAPPKQ